MSILMKVPPTICIVDDAADYRLILKHLFNQQFPAYLVNFFVDGQDLLDRLPSLSPLPNLILLDRHMPRLDGHQTLQSLKSDPTYRTIPVVLMSAYPTTPEINNCYVAYANSFLQKSTDLGQLTKQVNLVCQYWLELNLQAH